MTITDAHDEERKNRRLGDLRKNERPAGKSASCPKSFAGACAAPPTARSPWMETISFSRNALQQIEGKRRGIAGVIDAHRARAGFFERLGQMPRRFAIRFRRAHHANFALKFLGEKSRAQIVIAHVRGEHDRAFGRGQSRERSSPSIS